MKRLFTFGCSFTRYRYPTWADLLSKEFDYFENWALPGAGNGLIFNSLVECIKRNNVTANDTVIIMWTSIAREDRWTEQQGWITPGSIFNQDVYDNNFVKQFADPVGYLIRDLATVYAAKQLLEKLNCTWHFLSMVPFDYYDDHAEPGNATLTEKDIFDLYAEEIKSIKPSVFEVVFNGNWHSRPDSSWAAPITEQSYNTVKGSSWPAWNEFIYNKESVPKFVLDEVEKFFGKKPLRTDFHPVPWEHLFYINQVLPQYNISSDTVNWANNIEKNNTNWTTSIPKERF